MRLALALLFAMTSPAELQAFQPVSERDIFTALVSGKKLTRTGITLDVTPDGVISGRAFGLEVSGTWRWNAGYFCRDLFWGKQSLGYNCQAVRLNGRVVRFISDRGTGPHADLRLK
ncbi:MAG: dihydrodipicolinate reductase [Brevirhabdus sp.]